jgi:hypothetical protein
VPQTAIAGDPSYLNLHALRPQKTDLAAVRSPRNCLWNSVESVRSIGVAVKNVLRNLQSRPASEKSARIGFFCSLNFSLECQALWAPPQGPRKVGAKGRLSNFFAEKFSATMPGCGSGSMTELLRWNEVRRGRSRLGLFSLIGFSLPIICDLLPIRIPYYWLPVGGLPCPHVPEIWIIRVWLVCLW